MACGAQYIGPIPNPLGCGRELHFWSFIVAPMVFALGAGVSIYRGHPACRHPQPVNRPIVSYMAFAACLLFAGASWLVSLRRDSILIKPRRGTTVTLC